MSRLKPAIGNWYQNLDEGTIFEIVAYDADDGTIEIQYLDGEVEEYDEDLWQEITLAKVAPPEDWRAGYELSREDALDPDDPIHPQYADALDQFESDDSSDDWEDDD